MTLTSPMVESFHQKGYVVVPDPVFNSRDFRRLCDLFEENAARYGEDNSDYMAQIQTHDSRLLDFVLSDTILDLVEPLVGPDIALWSSHLISKPAGTGKATPWHTDAAYWEGRVSTMAGICTLWLAIDDATAENGCMRVIPGTHLSAEVADLSNYEPVEAESNIFGNQVRPELINAALAVDLILRPNQCSIHDSRVVHGASPNASTRRRAGYAMRYLPTTTKVISDHHLNHNHKVWLARGRDWAGNRYEN